jgi:PEP-CTERM motif
MSRFVHLAVAAASLVGMGGAQAAIVFSYTSKVDYLAAAGAQTEINFTDLAASTILGTQYAAQGVIFTDGNDQVFSLVPPIFSDGKGFSDGRGATASVTMAFSSLITSFGVDFPGAAQFDLFDGSTLVGSSPNFGGGGEGFFGGVVSDTGFNRVVMRDWSFPEGYYDNITFGSGSRTVPEPSTLLLVGAALVALGQRARRRS